MASTIDCPLTTRRPTKQLTNRILLYAMLTIQQQQHYHEFVMMISSMVVFYLQRDYTTRPTADNDIDGEHFIVITNRYLTSAGARRHNNNADNNRLTVIYPSGSAIGICHQQIQIEQPAKAPIHQRYAPKRRSTSHIHRYAPTDAESMMRSTMKTDYRTPPKQMNNNQRSPMHQKSVALADNILQGDRSFETRTTHRDDYRGAMSANRSIAIRPIGSALLKGVGQMQSSTINRDEYTAKNGDRYKLTKPVDCDNILNGDRILRNTNTQHRHDFQNGTKLAERYELKKPKDSDVFKGDGRFVDKTQYRHDFRKTDKQQRTKPIRPATSDALKGDGAMQQMTTNLQDYQANAGAERSIAIRPTESNMLKGNGAFESTSVYGEDYRDVGGKGERYELIKAKDTDVLMIKGDSGSSSRFIDTTQYQADYQTPQGGERVEVKRPMSSNILKGEGTMQSSTVSREEYQRKSVDRPTTHRPVDSDILKMNGKFAALTMYKDDYRHNNNNNNTIIDHDHRVNDDAGTTTVPDCNGTYISVRFGA